MLPLQHEYLPVAESICADYSDRGFSFCSGTIYLFFLIDYHSFVELARRTVRKSLSLPCRAQKSDRLLVVLAAQQLLDPLHRVAPLCGATENRDKKKNKRRLMSLGLVV